MTDRVVVLGCGYVGIELGRQLRNTCDVVGVRRSEAGIEAIESAGFTGVHADLTDSETLAAVPDADVLVFAASSGGRGTEAAREIYVEGQRAALEHFQSRSTVPDRYVYTSSTGVYGDHDGDWVDEESSLTPEMGKTKALAEAERIALEKPREYGIEGTVARLGGVYGPNRYRIERYLDGPVTDGYLNLVHRDDAAGAIVFFLQEGLARDETVLVVDNEPVSKWELADWLAAECGVDEPPKQTKAERLDDPDLSAGVKRRIRADKRCQNDKLRKLGYELAYPTYREGFRDAVESYRDETAD